MGNAMLTGFRGYAVHYGGRLNILHKGTRTLISAGAPACGTGSARASFVLDVTEVNCKRCLRLIKMHFETAATELPGEGEPR